MRLAHRNSRSPLRRSFAGACPTARATLLTALAMSCIFLPSTAAAQADPARAPMLATTVSEDEEIGWEDPELWGATFVEAVPEDTPLLVEYQTAAGAIRQRLELYEGGYVRCEWIEEDETIVRLLRLPEGAADHWKTLLEPLGRRVDGYTPPSLLSESDTSWVTVRTESGMRTYRFSTAAALPSDLGTIRELLDALAHAVTGDRQISNPLATYEPRVGDVLLGDDEVSYRIIRYLPEQRLVELRRSEPPMTLWVAVRDLYTMFTAIIPGGKPVR